MISPRGGDFYLATSGDHNLAVDRLSVFLRSGESANVHVTFMELRGDDVITVRSG
jgi:hypothetical protein